jgi:hypothetical protein
MGAAILCSSSTRLFFSHFDLRNSMTAMPHKLPTSLSSSDSSSDSSSAPMPESLRKLNFDPHGVYTFTNCSVDSKGQALDPSYPSYPYRYGPTMGNYDTPRVQSSSPPTSFPPSSNSGTSPPPASSLPTTAYPSPRKTGIFTPFRQETASPDLSKILKNPGQPKPYSFPPDSAARTSSSGVLGLSSTSVSHGRSN